MKPKTPEDLASNQPGKDKYTLYLDIGLMDDIKRRASKAKTSASKVVNEAIAYYIASLKDR